MEIQISIIHPSRSRPELALQAAKVWIDNIGLPDTKWEYILSLDNDDPTVEKYRELFSVYYKVRVVTNNNTSCISAINSAAVETVGNIIIVVSDDFLCPENWGQTLLDKLEGQQDFVVKTADGIQQYIITLPILDRAYYNRFGYVYYPGFQHMFCDTEMSAVGYLTGRLVNVDMEFKHLHYTKGLSKRDELNIRNDNTWRQGEKLYRARCRRNFDLPEDQIIGRLPRQIDMK